MDYHQLQVDLQHLIEGGSLEQLHGRLREPPPDGDRPTWNRVVVEFLCKQMWGQLGHPDPRSIAIPFFLDDISASEGDLLKLLAPGHLTLVISFLGELIDLLNVHTASSGTNYNLYQALLNVNIIINWLTDFHRSSTNGFFPAATTTKRKTAC
jgi:hypothetical protein